VRAVFGKELLKNFELAKRVFAEGLYWALSKAFAEALGKEK